MAKDIDLVHPQVLIEDGEVAGTDQLKLQTQEQSTEKVLQSRRDFLGYVATGVGSFIGIVTGVPILFYLSGGLKSKDQAQWFKLGRLEEFSEGTPKVVEFTLTRQDGWLELRESRSCWVVREGQKLVVFNGRCTHLGCAYSWQNSGIHADHFFCPCHEGLYDRGGFVVGGPPPRPLDRLETRIINDEVSALYLDFQPGVSGKVPK